MVNPFEKRATEYLRDDEAFLAVVTPEPLVTFFQKHAEEGKLYDRLTTIIGTPGSGKTTLARLFQYSTLRTLLRNSGQDIYDDLIDTLTVCGAIKEGSPAVIGGRVPLEAEYREFWEFPYPDHLKGGLMIALLQARTVLAWIRNVQSAGANLDDIEIVARPDAEAALTSIGGTGGPGLLARAREIELAIYNISAALVPPDVNEIDKYAAAAAYRPFDVIEAFQLKEAGQFLVLKPLVIFDDAHSLHPAQFVALQRWLSRREMRVSRWVLTRLDALTPADVLLEDSDVGQSSEPGLKKSRETTSIRMQSGGDRAHQRRAFRKMAKGMANRYLAQMDIFHRRRLNDLGSLLSIRVVPIAQSKREKLIAHIDSLQRRYSITDDRRGALEVEIANYLKETGEDSEEIRLSMLGILFQRYAKRVPQQGLFEDAGQDVEPSRPLTADDKVFEGAKVHLLHKYDRPYFYGIDLLCDTGSENAEQFLQLASRLVAQSETQLIRSKPPTLVASVQNNLLRNRATEMIREWDFPRHQQVKKLSDGIASACLKKSLEGNASLGGGANAFGILQDEFYDIPKTNPELARILQFGVAYNAFVLVPNHGTKKRLWVLIELGGVLLLHYGLTPKRGGFLERRTNDLVRILGED
ncbi:hypothetical protein [Phyllobacterium sophorae]|uniref:Uncharacterized protein n=1 Tax=Phyllobacterium sophorae TaxID=1520277 RepID=A0A2P7B3S5_9HYPH|nr:hypothetical protein [Phyllobacterium sophorae]PSH61079.1 hypothetical protein CU103_24270 [Phyllobacterium sophorae]